MVLECFEMRACSLGEMWPATRRDVYSSSLVNRSFTLQTCDLREIERQFTWFDGSSFLNIGYSVNYFTETAIN